MQTVACLLCASTEWQPLLTLRPDAHRRLHQHTAREPVRFVVCRACGFIYQSPRFTLEELKPIYVDEYRKGILEADGVPQEQYLEFACAKSRREFEWIDERFPGPGGRRVLEVGCATGQLLRYFKDAGWEALGIEPTKVFADYGSRVHGIEILPGLFEDADLKPGFDLVILSQVLEHVQHPEAVLTHAASLLGPDGRLYVSVPYYETYLSIRPARELFISTHLYAFSPASLASVASRCGLAVEKEGTMSRYLCVLLRPDSRVAARIVHEEPARVRRRVRRAALRYFVLHDSRYLAAEWVKRRLVGALGDRAGGRAVHALRGVKHRLLGMRS